MAANGILTSHSSSHLADLFFFFQAVRSTQSLEVPLVHLGEQMVSHKVIWQNLSLQIYALIWNLMIREKR